MRTEFLLKDGDSSGGLEVEWNMGEIERLSLSTNVYYNRRRKDDDRDVFRGFFLLRILVVEHIGWNF